ncbi:hypothetical protein [Hymenobacter rubripertinctus]|uniref:Uncharacterized protein n=1 Tax=Hymenobacter rubripertinctus TaxID=2029981 RepID=A0A418QN05_9BACT|nr:hypothetical protein [Hymenobacter rubripertinctus]RIY06460.1 hypothetical protein D0T11_18645 [Hymenobacter rubripertinctus]
MHEDRKVDALLRFHFKLDPQELDDEAYWQLWYDYLYARQTERNLLLGVMRQVISEAFPSN